MIRCTSLAYKLQTACNSLMDPWVHWITVYFLLQNTPQGIGQFCFAELLLCFVWSWFSLFHFHQAVHDSLVVRLLIHTLNPQDDCDMAVVGLWYLKLLVIPYLGQCPPSVRWQISRTQIWDFVNIRYSGLIWLSLTLLNFTKVRFNGGALS